MRCRSRGGREEPFSSVVRRGERLLSFRNGGVVLRDMKSYAHLKPGQKGTLRLVEKYGTSLVCVRYRYDEKRGVKLKTVELVVEERPCRPSSRYRDGDIVAVGVRYTEKALREALRAAGGRWYPEERLWRVAYGAIRSNAALVEMIVRE